MKSKGLFDTLIFWLPRPSLNEARFVESGRRHAAVRGARLDTSAVQTKGSHNARPNTPQIRHRNLPSSPNRIYPSRIPSLECSAVASDRCSSNPCTSKPHARTLHSHRLSSCHRTHTAIRGILLNSSSRHHGAVIPATALEAFQRWSTPCTSCR